MNECGVFDGVCFRMLYSMQVAQTRRVTKKTWIRYRALELESNLLQTHTYQTCRFGGKLRVAESSGKGHSTFRVQKSEILKEATCVKRKRISRDFRRINH